MNNQTPNSAAANNGANANTTYWYQPIQTVHNNIVVPELDNRQSIPDFLKMNKAESIKLLSLLSDWRMGFLFRTLYDALVDVEALKYITPTQCESLLIGYPLGIRVKFVGKLLDWRRLTIAEIVNNTIPLPPPPFPGVFL
ncbi:uncharacterized protein LOC111032888 [Myzus persicae]|uniref:uncharacterized protein LOC111032888 n=1 Tax=Myzus persicae TaxID=13164 RepID=UPI000B935B00|nr:uncharacterized protein LOC111032888 [Myzus persicae]